MSVSTSDTSEKSVFGHLGSNVYITSANCNPKNDKWQQDSKYANNGDGILRKARSKMQMSKNGCADDHAVIAHNSMLTFRGANPPAFSAFDWKNLHSRNIAAHIVSFVQTLLQLTSTCCEAA